ncbi:MAG TPA: hypothetical protein VJP77_07215, partial [Planctomycetota bacterium]|nr:hypothetical protein [Planctomycetota bacterium]
SARQVRTSWTRVPVPAGLSDAHALLPGALTDQPLRFGLAAEGTTQPWRLLAVELAPITDLAALAE